MFSKEQLMDLYIKKKLPVSAIARKLGCSQNKVDYWLAKRGIKKRTISDAIYNKWNPNGDPFKIRGPANVPEAILYGLGVGLYWGEGTKASKTSVRIGNSDPQLIKRFIDFLTTFYAIDRKKIRFGLQIFGDMNSREALNYWASTLSVKKDQFYPSIIVTPYRGVGNYRKKTKYGVVTLYFNNKKLRDIICGAIDQVSVDRPM